MKRLFRTVKIACAALALSGCATTRYVDVPCISKGQQLPSEPSPVKSKLTGKADEDTRTLAGGLLRWQAYGRGLRTILEGCQEK